MHALPIQSTMMQVTASGGKACGKDMMATIKTPMDKTKWEYAWRHAQNEHPGIFMPTKAKNQKDAQAEWMTVHNINHWFDMAKDYSIKNGFVKDEPNHICDY